MAADLRELKGPTEEQDIFNDALVAAAQQAENGEVCCGVNVPTTYYGKILWRQHREYSVDGLAVVDDGRLIGGDKDRAINGRTAEKVGGKYYRVVSVGEYYYCIHPKLSLNALVSSSPVDLDTLVNMQELDATLQESDIPAEAVSSLMDHLDARARKCNQARLEREVAAAIEQRRVDAKRVAAAARPAILRLFS